MFIKQQAKKPLNVQNTTSNLKRKLRHPSLNKKYPLNVAQYLFMCNTLESRTASSNSEFLAGEVS